MIWRKTGTTELESSLSTTHLSDGDKRLWVKVEAPGYWTWEEAIRMKLNENKSFFYLNLEIELWDANQGLL
jgi:hypothetical protein